MASEEGSSVELYIYDLTNGLAAVLAPALLEEQPVFIGRTIEPDIGVGRPVEGVWHTSLVVYGREYFYGGAGITSCSPGGTQLGAPHQIDRLGETFVPYQAFVDYLQGLSSSSYSGSQYRLMEHNCNHFSDEVAQFLCGARVPKHILQQPDVLSPPLRMALSALLDGIAPSSSQAVYAQGVRHVRAESPEFVTLNDQIEQARAAGADLERRRCTLAEKLARKERRRERKRAKHGGVSVPDDMAEAVEAVPVAAAAGEVRAGPSSALLDADVRRDEEMKRRAKDPPIVYRDIDGEAEFEKLLAALKGVTLSAEEQQSVEEMRQYLVQGEGSWVLGDDFLAFIGRVLHEPGAELVGLRAAALRCLAAMALRDDVSLVLHQDRRHHALLSYAHGVDQLPLPEQQALTLFLCNLCEHLSASEWLLYISEWEAPNVSYPLSNIRVTTKVCVHAALSEQEELRELGTALMYNVATKEVKTVVFDEVCAELALALLQLLGTSVSEEHQWRALRALARLVQHSPDVPQLIAMVGPQPEAFRGTSPRVDEQLDIIATKVK